MTGTVDFVPMNPQFVFDNIDNNQSCFTVTSFDDDLIEGNETFRYEIGSVQHEFFMVRVAEPSTVTVTLVDNDIRGS